jgi:anaphase-promoting complex subunit 3
MMADGRYGMGVVYAKTGKLRHAEHHYRRAADINPSNAVLLSSIGSVSHFPTRSHQI